MRYDEPETNLDADLPPLRQSHHETESSRLLEVRMVRLELIHLRSEFDAGFDWTFQVSGFPALC